MPVLSESSSSTKNSTMSGTGNNTYIFYSLLTIPLIFLTILTTQKFLKKNYRRQNQNYVLRQNYIHPAVAAKSSHLATRMSSAESALTEELQKEKEKQHDSKSLLISSRSNITGTQPLPSSEVVSKIQQQQKGDEGEFEEQQQQSQKHQIQEHQSHSAPFEMPLQTGGGAGGGVLEFDFNLPKPRIPRPPQLAHPAMNFQPRPLIQDNTSGVSSATKPGAGKTTSRRSSSSSLIHPEPPSPTIISLSPLKIQTQQPQDYSTPYPLQGQPQQVPLHQIQFVPSPTEYTSFEALYSQNPPYHSETEEDISFEPTTSQDSIPRRRSYTKSLSNGSEVSGEIVVSNSTAVEGQQWRRHTRVFGGGVCRACEESESQMRRLSA